MEIERCQIAMAAFRAYCTGMGIMLLLRLEMIQTEPMMMRKTTSTPKARAGILFVLSGPLRRCRKNTRWDADLREGEYDQSDGKPKLHGRNASSHGGMPPISARVRSRFEPRAVVSRHSRSFAVQRRRAF